MDMPLTLVGDIPLQFRTGTGTGRSIEGAWYGGRGLDWGDDDLTDDPFIFNMVKAMRGFVACVDNADFKSRDAFQRAMSFLSLVGVADSELADLFETTPSAVNRWGNGRSAPTPIVRTAIVHAGLELARRNGILIAGKRFDAITGRPMSERPGEDEAAPTLQAPN